MGIGKLADPGLVFVRQFRWTLEGTELPTHFIKTASFDCTYLNFSIYEVFDKGLADTPAELWFKYMRTKTTKQLSDYTFTFTTFDGCGTPLYSELFNGIHTIHEDEQKFDYAVSDAAVRGYRVKYINRSRVVHLKNVSVEPVMPVVSNGPKYAVQFNQVDGQNRWTTEAYDVEVVALPSCEIEEHPVHHLNAKVQVPGVCRWLPMKIKIAAEDSRPFLSKLTRATRLNLYGYCNNVKQGTWTLCHPKILSNKKENDKVALEITYENPGYSSCELP